VGDSSSKLELPQLKTSQPKASRRGTTALGAAGQRGTAAGAPAKDPLAAGSSQTADDQSAGDLRAGDSKAGRAAPDITQLVLDYDEVLYRYAYRLTGSAADAEDLTQQTFLVAHEKIGQVRQADSVRSWLFTVLRNAYLKDRRRTTAVAAGNLALDLDSVSDKATLARAEENPIDSEQLQRALGELADEFKLVLLLFYFEERSYREIADILQVPPGTVMSRLSRAKAHLRSKLFPLDKEAIHAGKVVR
jgi:RNA polymerase sigma-70 factor, ECF subfamily